MAFTKARKEQLYVKALLNGPSGSGKTYGALRLAAGIARACNSRVAAIDTENRRIRYYADEFDFDDMTMTAPYTPEKYIEAINDAARAGYKVLVIDSMTHEWTYCLELINNMPGSNSYTKWKTVTPRHDAFKEAILQSPLHIIATVRGKDEYIIEENEKGKKVPKKVGVGYSQRDGLEFDYTVTFTLDQDTHRYTVTKDNTHLFEGRFDMLTEQDGEALYKWANEGTVAPPPPPSPAPQAPAAQANDELTRILSAIGELPGELYELGYTRTEIANTIRGVTGGVANYKNITDPDMAAQVLAALEKMKEEKTNE